MCRTGFCHSPRGERARQGSRPAQSGNCAQKACRRARPDRACWRRRAAMSGYRASPGYLQVVAHVKAGREKGKLVGALFKTKAVARFLQDVRDQPVSIVGRREIGAYEGTPAFLALKRRMNDQLAHLHHVHNVDGIQPLIVCHRALCGNRHVRQYVETDFLISSSRERILAAFFSTPTLSHISLRSFSLTLAGETPPPERLRNFSSLRLSVSHSLSEMGRSVSESNSAAMASETTLPS